MRAFLTIIFFVSFFLQQPPQNAVIEGIVQAVGTDAPIGGATVVASSGVPDGTVQTMTDNEGRFRLSLNPGQYTVRAMRQGFVGEQEIQPPDLPGTRVTLAPGQRLQGTVLRLVPTGTITGRVFDPEGNVMEGVGVSLWHLGWAADGRRQLRQATIGPRGASTNDLGEYRLYWVPPGEYYLSARDNSGVVRSFLGPSQRYVTTYHPGVPDPSQAAAIRVHAGEDLRGINLSLSRVRSTSVRGRLVSPLAEVADSVAIIRMSPVEKTLVFDGVPVSINQNNTFVAQNLVPGRYRIMAALRIPNQFNLSGEVILDVAEDPIENVVLTVAPSQTLPGTLQIEDASPEVRAAVKAGKVHVSLAGDSNAAFLSTSADVGADGNFAIPDVGIIQYRISLLGLPPDAYISSARLGGADVLENGFSVRGDPPGPLQISVSGLGGRVAGIVRTAQNEIPARARVVLVPEPRWRHRSDLFKIANTDAYGRFNLQGIAPGTYKLFAFETVPFGAYYDSDFLRPYEGQAKAVAIEKNDYVQAEIQFTPRTTN